MSVLVWKCELPCSESDTLGSSGITLGNSASDDAERNRQVGLDAFLERPVGDFSSAA